MIQYAVDRRPCDRTKPHRRHRYVPDPTVRDEFLCEGHSGVARCLGELLARRPELADVTAVTVINRLAVAAA